LVWLARGTARFDVWLARGTARFASLCLIASACSLEVPSTGLNVSAFDASIGAPIAAAPGTHETPQTELTDDAQLTAQQEGGLEPASDGRDAAVATTVADAASAPDPGCVLDGRFALRIVFQVGWVGTEFASIVPIIDTGEGELSITMLMELKTSAARLEGSFRTCAAEGPEFAATLSRERYQAHFAEAVWDAPSMPMFSTSLHASCQIPGCRVSTEPLTTLTGAALASAMDPWPQDVSAGSWPDHDGDGAPGIAVSMLGPEQGPYAYPPLDLLSLRRVGNLGLGQRVTIGLDGTLDSCDVMQGATGEGRIETRAVFCQAVSSPAECQPRELEFLNQNLPVWTVRQGAFQAKRVARDADCHAVRHAFGPVQPPDRGPPPQR
jgi:hypothetical protein